MTNEAEEPPISRAESPSPTYRRPRLADIAAAVNVHVSTVSRVLNGDPALSIRPEIRDRIIEVAQRQNYRPNAMARALKRSRTGSLAMVVPLLRNPIWATIQRGALQRAESLGTVVMVLEEPEESARPPADYEYLVDESRADGLLIATAVRGRGPGARVPKTPHVYMNRRGPRTGNDVVMDEEKAMGLFIGHLADLGHRRVAVIDGIKSIDTVHRRTAAVRHHAAARGVTARFLHEAHTEAGGYEAARRLLHGSAAPTAIGVGSLNQLFGVSKALREAGASVPSDISVVSFDEDECLAYLDVPVTSIAMPLEELGAAAVEALLARVEGRPGSDVLVSDPVSLVHRSSTAPPRR